MSALPRWLRWLVFLPVGVGGAVLLDIAVNAVCNAAGLSASPDSTEGVIRAALLALAWGCALTVFPAVLSPRPWAVAVTMLAVGLLIRIITVAYPILTTPYLRARLPSVALALAAAIAAHALGGGLGLYVIRRLAPRLKSNS